MMFHKLLCVQKYHKLNHLASAIQLFINEGLEDNLAVLTGQLMRSSACTY